MKEIALAGLKERPSGGMDCHFNESDGDIQRGCLKKFGLSGKSSGSTEASDQSYVTWGSYPRKLLEELAQFPSIFNKEKKGNSQIMTWAAYS